MNITELLKQAHEVQASDIIINVYKKNGSRILFRIQGEMKLFQECSPEEAYALWKNIHESQEGEINPKFNPFLQGYGLSKMVDQTNLPIEYSAVKFINSPNMMGGTGFILAMRLQYKQPTENLDIRSLGYSKEQQADLENYIKSDEIKVAVIAGHTSKFPRHI